MPEQPGRRYLAVVAACSSLFIFAVSAALLPAALLRAAGDLGVTPEVLSWAVTTQFVACFLATIAGGVLSDRYGLKPVLLVAAAALTGGAVLWTMAHDLVTAHLAAGLMGVGGGVLESLGSALLVALYPERRGLVLNLSQGVFCAGAIAGPAVMAILLPLGIAWRTFFAAEAVLGGLLFILYRAIPTSPGGNASDEGLAAGFRQLRTRNVMLLAAALFLYVLAESGVAFYLNLHLQTIHAAPERWAVLGISAYWAAMLVGRLICALLPASLPAGRVVCILAVMGAAVLAAQSLATGWLASLLLFAATGLIFSGSWPLIVALTAQTNPQRTGSALGGVIAVGSLGGAAVPLAASLVGTHVFLCLAVALLAILPLLGAVRTHPR